MFQQLPTTEKANVITHFIGCAFGLLVFPFYLGDDLVGSALGLAVFCFTFTLMFFTSSAYHLAITVDNKRRWRSADHISIYLLIAGTYTYFILTYLNNPKGHIILAVLWGGSLIGAIFKLFFVGRFRVISTLIYVGMGWAGVAIIGDFIKEIPSSELVWISIGGASYMIGTVFYLWKKYTHHHAIWHLFVLGGAISHWFAIHLSVN